MADQVLVGATTLRNSGKVRSSRVESQGGQNSVASVLLHPIPARECLGTCVEEYIYPYCSWRSSVLPSLRFTPLATSTSSL